VAEQATHRLLAMDLCPFFAFVVTNAVYLYYYCYYFFLFLLFILLFIISIVIMIIFVVIFNNIIIHILVPTVSTGSDVHEFTALDFVEFSEEQV
jgi:hypothetical protein